MLYLILALLALGVFSALVHLLSHRKGGRDVVVPAATTCATCRGTENLCEQECVLKASTEPIVYFDDEELDRYRGRASDAYSDEEADAFEEVMTTMRPEEVKDWNRSLILRGINVPDQIKDELFALLQEG